MNDILNTSLLYNIISAAVILCSAYGIGTLFRCKDKFISFSCAFALIAFAGWITPSLKIVKTPLAVLIFSSAAWGAIQLPRQIKNHLPAFSVGVLLFTAACGSFLLPPYTWDECVYQTALLKQYVSAGNNAVIPDNPFSAFPSLPHSVMRIAIEIAGGGLYLPRLLSGAILAISLAKLFEILRSSGKNNYFFFFTAAIISPVTLVLSRANYVEQYILLFGISGMLSIVKLRNNPVKFSIFTAICGAACICVKLTGAGVLLAMACMYMFFCKKRFFMKTAVMGSAVFLIFAVPFFLRPFLATGNPFYPFAASIFNSDQAVLLVSRHHHLLGSYRYGMEFVPGICYGWLFSAFAGSIFDGITTNWQFSIMFVLQIAATVYLFKNDIKRKKIAMILLICAAVMYIFWAASSQQTRFLFPLLWLSAVLCTFTSSKLPGKAPLITGAAVLAASFINIPSNHLKHFVTAWKILPHIQQDKERFLISATRDPGYFEMVDFLKSTPENSRILLLLNERRTLYMPRKAVIGEPFFQPLNTPVPDSAEKLFENIKSFDYIVVSAANTNPDFQKSTEKEMLRVAEMLELLKNSGKLQLAFSDKGNSYLIFRCGDAATGTTF